MEPREILRKLLTREELEESLRKALKDLQGYLEMIRSPKKDPFNQAYRMAAFRSLDIAHIYDLMGDREKAEFYYRSTLDYLDCANFQPLWIRLESLRALGKYNEALDAAVSSPHHSKIELAELYREAGSYEIAQKIYAELALKQHCDPERMENFIYPQCLQFISDLWEKANNTEKAREYNQLALRFWEKVENNIERSLYPIEEAWLYEGTGHIYERAGDVARALKYYQKALEKYELANREEYRASSETHYEDGDWNHYAGYFYTQLPETLMLNLKSEYFMKFHLRRIRYRILKLKMQEKTGIRL